MVTGMLVWGPGRCGCGECVYWWYTWFRCASVGDVLEVSVVRDVCGVCGMCMCLARVCGRCWE